MKISSIELQLDLRILYLSIIHQYTNFRPNYRSEGGAMMDLKAVKNSLTKLIKVYKQLLNFSGY